MTTTLEKSALGKYEKILKEDTRSSTARDCGRLLWEVTAHEPVLRDAISAALCILNDCDWSTGSLRDKDINEIKDHLVAGFTERELYMAANRHEARHPEYEQAPAVA